MFSERKVAQMAAYFLGKTRDKRMYLIRLMKLLYLADRQAMADHGFPISGDHMVSMDNGPVLSGTLNLMNGAVRPNRDGWESWVSDRENHYLALCENVDSSRENLNALSDMEINVLETVWTQFGHLRRWDLVNYTHDNCAEWRDPHGSSMPIDYKDVLKAVGKTDEEAEYFSKRIQEETHLDRIFASL